MDENQALEDDAVAWKYPPLGELESGTSAAELDPEPQETETAEATPKLPDALFARADEDATTVYWYVDEDLDVVVMASGVLDDEQYREIAQTPVERDDDEYVWEVPTALVTGRATERGRTHVPDDARFESGAPIHFRASKEMLDSEVRTCYALTANRLAALSAD
ncbi:hypothetical protein VB773_09370 [Haloarculaceae archaeon H-GB2-1]|nr:hypothetical protein [Haloarculaceae archaeon H-GB1-1]MEA5386253.1 hypothetical protein [Haloarculaceae archaeon H-GB11]MEA5407756.1 hypothetical protein [Haloarculaceae archaeon H-GB2-1]